MITHIITFTKFNDLQSMILPNLVSFHYAGHLHTKLVEVVIEKLYFTMKPTLMNEGNTNIA